MQKNVEIPPFLNAYAPLVEFLGDMLGEHCEVVLHDVTHYDNSIVAIKNGHISDRKVGGSLTDLSLKILKNKSYLDNDYLVNYSSKTRGGKILRSSTLFIKDDSGEVVGLLCINVDLGPVVEARNMLDRVIGGMHSHPLHGINLNGGTPVEHGSETFVTDATRPIEELNTSIEELTSSIILSTLSEMEVSPDRMTAEERMQTVKRLNDKGVFLIKGAISEVAAHLKASEATIYRYLGKQQNGK